MRLNHSHKNVIPRQARTGLACPESARNSRKFVSSRGFTIIELIIAVAIIVILSGIILANYHASRRQQTLQAEAQKLASTLRKAQNMALAGETSICPGDTEAVQHNYGVDIFYDTEYRYRLFVDCNTVGGEYDSGDIELEFTTLPSGVTLNATPHVVFETPRGLATEDLSVNIILDSRSKTVSVNAATGQISID